MAIGPTRGRGPNWSTNGLASLYETKEESKLKKQSVADRWTRVKNQITNDGIDIEDLADRSGFKDLRRFIFGKSVPRTKTINEICFCLRDNNYRRKPLREHQPAESRSERRVPVKVTIDDLSPNLSDSKYRRTGNGTLPIIGLLDFNRLIDAKSREDLEFRLLSGRGGRVHPLYLNRVWELINTLSSNKSSQ